MKSKSFHCSKNGLAQPIAAALGSHLQCVCDKMPPAYPCEKERVVFVGIEMNGKVPAPVVQFCKDLNETRTKAVAFYVINKDGSTNGLEEMEALLAKNNVQKVGETLGIAVKSSFFKKGSVTEADVAKSLDWAKNIIANL